MPGGACKFEVGGDYFYIREEGVKFFTDLNF